MKFGIRLLSIFALAAAAVHVSPAQAAEKTPPPEVPLQLAAFGADVVAVGEVTSDAVLQTIEDIRLPDQSKPWKMDAAIVEFKVSQVLKDGRGQATSAPASAPSSEPASIPADGKFRLIVQARGNSLAKGQKLIVCTFAVDGRQELYLPATSGYRLEESQDAIKSVKAALDTSKWAWGKADKGLQLAAIVPPEMQFSYPPIMVVNGRKGLNALIHAGIALKNVSDKPITVPFKDLAGKLKISATALGDAPVDASWISDAASVGKKQPPEKIDLAAGEIVLLSPEGPTRFGCKMTILVQYRKVDFQASAEVDGRTLESGVTSVEVQRIELPPEAQPKPR